MPKFLTPFSLWEKGWGRGFRGVNRMSVEMFCAHPGKGTAEHLIPTEKNKDNEGKTRQAPLPSPLPKLGEGVQVRRSNK